MRRWLALLSGLMLGCAFPPLPTSTFAAFAFVPFFVLFESVDDYGESFRYSYLTFLIFNIITLYWTGGFTHGHDWYMMVAGALLLFAHPLFFLVPIAAWVFIRRQFGFSVSIYSFPFVWVSFEFLHSLTNLAFPWLTLGNTQASNLSVIQFSAFTGVYGISFWLLCLNVLVYYLYAKLALREWALTSPKTFGWIVSILAVYAVPLIYGESVLPAGRNQQLVGTKGIRVGIVQPNIDPFEKWQGNPVRQVSDLQQMTNEVVADSVDLVLWPETAIPFHILDPRNRAVFDLIKEQVDLLGLNLLTGAPILREYKQGETIPKSSRIGARGQRYDAFNSAILLQPRTDEIQEYEKILLVPFAERVPFSEQLSFLNAMEWNFGLGGWGIGKDTTVFVCRARDSSLIKFSNLICFESIYPGFVADFVRRGAQFLTVITNDSWWGNTSGAYQHEQTTVLRAVENRRWIVVCGNGGISCVIDPFGHILQSTELYARKTMTVAVEPRMELTFYSKHGDWFPEVCLVLGLAMVAGAIGKKTYSYIRKSQENEVH
ncbi:MAG: apolipoprotein N-acyltransferase [Bacteroidota bacterium]